MGACLRALDLAQSPFTMIELGCQEGMKKELKISSKITLGNSK
jgi:hypothetical protein